jgi:hypothetical protein
LEKLNDILYKPFSIRLADLRRVALGFCIRNLGSDITERVRISMIIPQFNIFHDIKFIVMDNLIDIPNGCELVEREDQDPFKDDPDILQAELDGNLNG